MISDADLARWFSHQRPTIQTRQRYDEIRTAGLLLAQAILRNTPSSADQTAAIRKVREAVMTANAAVTEGLLFAPQVEPRRLLDALQAVPAPPLDNP